MILNVEKKDMNKHQLELALYGMSVGDICLDITLLNLAFMRALSFPGATFRDVCDGVLPILEQQELPLNKELLEESSGIYKWIKKIKREKVSNDYAEDFIKSDSGSLKWITPLAFYLKEEPSLEKRMAYCHAISSICYEHPVSEIACHYYVELLIHLLKENNFNLALSETNSLIKETYGTGAYSKELDWFKRILDLEVITVPLEDRGGEIDAVRNLELVIWAVATSDSYEESVTKLINLSKDNHVAISLAGVLSGICFGEVGQEWLEKISNRPNINYYISFFCE